VERLGVIEKETVLHHPGVVFFEGFPSLADRRDWLSSSAAMIGATVSLTHIGSRRRTSLDHRFSSLRVFGSASSLSPTRSGASARMSYVRSTSSENRRMAP